MPDEALAIVGRSVTDFEEWIGGAFAGLIGSIVDAGTVVLLGSFLTFYVLHDYELAWSSAVRGLDPGQQAVVTEHGSVALDRVSAYLRGTADRGVDALAALIYLPLLGYRSPDRWPSSPSSGVRPVHRPRWSRRASCCSSPSRPRASLIPRSSSG